MQKYFSNRPAVQIVVAFITFVPANIEQHFLLLRCAVNWLFEAMPYSDILKILEAFLLHLIFKPFTHRTKHTVQ